MNETQDSLAPPPGTHQTINRVVRILEEVVYRPGSTYAEITRAVGAPKSSIYGFIRGLLSVDWLIEQNHRLYLGPAFYSLAISSGHVRAGLVTQADLESLYRDTGLTAFVGVRAGNHLLYIAEAGSDAMASFEARQNIRRDLLHTAGGRALLAFMPQRELQDHLRGRPADQRADVEDFLQACPTIRDSHVAVNVNAARGRTAVATVILDPRGQAVASVTLVGPTPQVLSRVDSLGALLRERIAEWEGRTQAPAREPI